MASVGPWLKAKMPGVHRFLTRRDRYWPLAREALAGILVLALLFAALFTFTGQPLKGGYPVVVVTTGSMMHCQNGMPILGRDCEPDRWGRLGTIDPGDLVFVRRIHAVSDVTTAAEGEGGRYGDQGDVIVYRKNGSPTDTPIIHRALFWIQYNGDGTFDLPAFGVERATSLPAEAIALTGCSEVHGRTHRTPADSGFITRGDNNGGADQCHESNPARLEWVLGKARGEVPWIGLLNLLWGDIRTKCEGGCNYANAGGDSKVMFFATIGVLVTAPWLVERLLRRRREGDED